MADRFTVQLLARTPLSSRVERMRFRASVPFRWAAGQYVLVGQGKGQELFLPYSLASAYDPGSPSEFDLAVTLGAGGVMDTLPLAAELVVEGPLGEFTWQAAPSPVALLVGVGTGIAPLRALIEEELGRDSRVRLLLLAGHRSSSDILFAEDFARFAAREPRFRFIPTLSAGGPEWAGLRGRVQAQVIEALSSEGPLDAYVCGRLDMVREVVDILTSHGIDPSRIRSEGF